MNLNEPAPATDTSTNDRFAREVLSVLLDADAKLSEDGILAVIAMRRQCAMIAAIERFILDGTCEAVHEPDNKENAALYFDDFSFYALADEERDLRRKPGRQKE